MKMRMSLILIFTFIFITALFPQKLSAKGIPVIDTEAILRLIRYLEDFKALYFKMRMKLEEILNIKTVLLEDLKYEIYSQLDPRDNLELGGGRTGFCEHFYEYGSYYAFYGYKKC